MIDQKTLWETSATPPNATIIAAGPLTKQPSSDVYRIVLRDLGEDGFVVHSQSFRLCDGRLIPEGYSNGDYYKADSLVRATVRFCERLKQHAKYFLSIPEQVNGTNGSGS